MLASEQCVRARMSNVKHSKVYTALRSSVRETRRHVPVSTCSCLHIYTGHSSRFCLPINTYCCNLWSTFSSVPAVVLFPWKRKSREEMKLPVRQGTRRKDQSGIMSCNILVCPPPPGPLFGRASDSEGFTNRLFSRTGCRGRW